PRTRGHGEKLAEQSQKIARQNGRELCRDGAEHRLYGIPPSFRIHFRCRKYKRFCTSYLFASGGVSGGRPWALRQALMTSMVSAFLLTSKLIRLRMLAATSGPS